MELLEKHPAVVLAGDLWSVLDAAGSASNVVQLIEQDPIARLPDDVWREIDELARQEKGRPN